MSALTEKLQTKEQSRKQSQGRQIWKPNEGEILEGVVIEHATTITPFGEAEYIDIRDDKGQIWTVYVNKILGDQIDAEAVGKGDRIAIKFLGLEKSKRGNKRYKNYLLAKDDLPSTEDNNIVDVDETIEE
jgi:hypothetical protein